LAPIEIIRAEAEVASRQQDLETSETNVLQQETILKTALSRNGIASPAVAGAHIVPTDPIRIPDVEKVEPVQDLTAHAMESRPELAQSRILLDNSRISLKGTRSALLPTIDAYGSLRNTGLAGTPNTLPLPGGNGLTNGKNADPFTVGGYGTVLGQIFSRNFPDYSIGVQLNIPLRNRSAQADYATAQLNLRQSELQVERLVNGLRIDVQNALTAVRQARARFQSARKNRTLQEQTLDAEQKKYALGASTLYLVIQAQRDLATARGSEVAAQAAYAQARTQLDVATGYILENNNVQMDEAMKGSVSKPPSQLPVLDNK
ncbi:MAG: TolC family protein, partial [Bryobacteraceae bacterium]